MIEVKKIGPILEPTINLFENKAVLNHGVYWEVARFVNSVVFPTGTAIFDEDLNIYYAPTTS